MVSLSACTRAPSSSRALAIMMSALQRSSTPSRSLKGSRRRSESASSESRHRVLQLRVSSSSSMADSGSPEPSRMMADSIEISMRMNGMSG